ncbi:MAG: glucose-6-phosphate dehydrogenase assembly protein OpcA [Elainella sp. Prado103]|jgi:glucose-6-phosphate dehydrogenase assembly protein OpcA|nr:glucose-6-phosphate dehydrogenase assembly protein OpcA [Elainella sp. Prado103]
MSTPLVTLQKPKDISIDEIEAELSQIWHAQVGDNVSPVAIRASTFSMVIYEPEEFQQLLAVLGFYDGPIEGVNGPLMKEAVKNAQKAYGLSITGRVDPATLVKLREEYAKLPPEQAKLTNADFRGQSVSDAIAAQNPCRIITLCPILGEDRGVTAQVSAYCPILKKSSSNLMCCEYITLQGTKEALNRVGDMAASLMIPELPKFIWWKATPNPEQELFKKMVECCRCIILDSSYYSDPESEFLKMAELIEAETYVADLNWHRFSAWQELTAAAFDPPERRESLQEIDQVVIDYEKGNPAQALMFLGWLASRLEWQPTSYTETRDLYDLIHIDLVGPNQKIIKAELAGVPIGDPGEIIGDLIGISLTSSNPKADCNTIICSETTGCMRMEAKGGAQIARTEQVTATSDQKAEFLMSQQLQRWGRDVLYEESMAVVAQMLRLRQV